MTCVGEGIVDCDFTSSPHLLMVYGRTILVLVKDKDLLSSIRIVFKRSSIDATTSDGLPP